MWCKEVWLVEECLLGKNWKQLFLEWKVNWGCYELCYVFIKRVWSIIEEFLKFYCFQIYSFLNEGLIEEEINEIELGKFSGKFI